MFDFNSIMALKELVAGEQQPELVQNDYKGSALNPGDIGGDGTKKQIAKPYAKMQAKIGQKYVPKQKQKQMKMEEKSVPPSQKIEDRHKIWDQEEVKELPISKQDPRKMPEFETLYRQKVGTEDVYLGLSGTDQSSNHCHQITYKIQLPGVQMKQIQLDLSQRQMVVQTKQFYLMQHFQYPTDPKKAKAKFISDKEILELIIAIKREQQ